MYYNMNNKIVQNCNKDRVSNNGRVDLLNPPDISSLFAMYDKIPANQCTTFRNATLGQWDETPLSEAFFSKENIQINLLVIL